MNLIKNSKALKLAVIIIMISLFYPQEAFRAYGDTIKVTVASPWLMLITSFIGGPNVTVSSLQEWDSNGELTRVSKSKFSQLVSSECLIIAFDLEEAKKIGLLPEKQRNLKALYSPFPVEGGKINTALSDPSVIPFVAQRILTVLAAWDSANYPYYQRRLAELQARLYSTVLSGRKVLKDQPVFDLTGSSKPLLQAAGCKISSPASSDVASWSAGKNMELLTSQLATCAEGKAIAVIDCDSPKAIRKALDSAPGVFMLTRPPFTQDYPSFLHDQYLSLWLKLTAKPIPPPAKTPAKGRKTP